MHDQLQAFRSDPFMDKRWIDRDRDSTLGFVTVAHLHGE